MRQENSAAAGEKPLIRLKRKLGIENLWIFILAILACRDSYAYEIIKKIKCDFGFDPGKVLPYVVLKKLELEGYVMSYRRDARKYYKITEKGRKLLDDGVNYIEEILMKIKERSGVTE